MQLAIIDLFRFGRSGLVQARISRLSVVTYCRNNVLPFVVVALFFTRNLRLSVNCCCWMIIRRPRPGSAERRTRSHSSQSSGFDGRREVTSQHIQRPEPRCASCFCTLFFSIVKVVRFDSLLKCMRDTT